jgi:hypothetical protein
MGARTTPVRSSGPDWTRSFDVGERPVRSRPHRGRRPVLATIVMAVKLPAAYDLPSLITFHDNFGKTTLILPS